MRLKWAFWDILGHFGTTWDILGPFGTLWDNFSQSNRGKHSEKIGNEKENDRRAWMATNNVEIDWILRQIRISQHQRLISENLSFKQSFSGTISFSDNPSPGPSIPRTISLQDIFSPGQSISRTICHHNCRRIVVPSGTCFYKIYVFIDIDGKDF